MGRGTVSHRGARYGAGVLACGHRLGRSGDYQSLRDGEKLYKRFDQAGFGDLFYAPTSAEWQELRKSKLPDFGSALTKRLPLDTLYTLLADVDFETYQEDMDRQIEARIG